MLIPLTIATETQSGESKHNAFPVGEPIYSMVASRMFQTRGR